jgi:hypothetical protein
MHRRGFLSLLLTAAAHDATADEALAISNVDLIQVAVDLRRMTVSPLADQSDEFPSSPYCRGKPEFCSLKHVRDLRNPAIIDAVTAFVNQRLSGWRVPWFESPIDDVQLYFWRDQRHIATFGSGRNYFSRGTFPHHKFITASPDELEKFHKLARIK